MPPVRVPDGPPVGTLFEKNLNSFGRADGRANGRVTALDGRPDGRVEALRWEAQREGGDSHWEGQRESRRKHASGIRTADIQVQLEVNTTTTTTTTHTRGSSVPHWQLTAEPTHVCKE